MYKIIYNKITVLGLSVLLLAGAGCSKIKDFGDTNVNPGGVTSPNLAALLTNVESGIGGYAASTRGGLYCQYYTETQYTESSLYATTPLEFSGNYSGPLMDLQNIINRNTDPATAAANTVYGANRNQIAVARILKAFQFWTMTDRWGSIPYSEALQLNVPKYDDQEFVYKDLIKELTEAIAQFDDNGNPVKGDIIYGGSNAKWKKLANSLRMQMALRLSKVYPSAGDYSATQFAAAVADPNGFISTNDDNFLIAYPGGPFKNVWYALFDGRKDYAESKTMTDLLAGLGDSRVSAYGANANGFSYGLERADATTVPEPWPLILSPSNRGQASPIVILGASTVVLSYAEAIERGWIAGLTTTDAEAAYNSGIALSFAQWGLTMPGAYLGGNANYSAGIGVAAIGQNSFGSIPAAANATTTTKLQRIQLQRFIALYPDGTQGWCEWRRTGVPNIMATTYATSTSGNIPRRYTYGTNEYTLNAAGVAQGVAALTGGDTQDARVWWDN